MVIDLAMRLLADRLQTDLIPPVLVWVVAPTSPLYDQIVREYIHHLRALKPKINRRRGGERVLLFDEKIHIEFKSGYDPDAMVGSGVDIAHVTEGALLKTEAYDLLRGRLASPGRAAIKIVNGTPGENPETWYADTYRAGESGDEDVIFACHKTVDNPTLGPLQLRELVKMRDTMSKRRWDANWGAQLVPSGSGLFPGIIEVCRSVPQRGVKEGRYVTAVDPAGLGSDAFCVSVFRIDGGYHAVPEQVHLSRWIGQPWSRNKVRLAEVLKQYPGEVHFDSTARISMTEEVKDMCRKLGRTFRPHTITSSIKGDMIDHLIHLIESGGVAFIKPTNSNNAKQQFNEFQDFQETKTIGGHARYGAPKGKHDDTVIAACLATWPLRRREHVSLAAQLRRVGVLG